MLYALGWELVISKWFERVKHTVSPTSCGTPRASDPKAYASTAALSSRLKGCWSKDLNWDLVPERLKEVSVVWCTVILFEKSEVHKRAHGLLACCSMGDIV